MFPRGHPHLKGDSFFRYRTFQKPDYVYPKKNCKEKFLECLGYFFKSE